MTPRQQYYRTYSSWVNMKQRCTNPKCPDFPRYGGRGIKMDPSFMTFEGFLAYVLATIGDRPTKTYLDRVNGDEGYEPGNIRWLTITESNRHRSRPTVVRRFTDEEITLIEDMRRLGHKVMDIAFAVSAHTQAVTQVLRRAGLTEPKGVA